MSFTKNKILIGNNESGVVLVVCMIILLMLSLIGIASIMTSNTDLEVAGNEMSRSEAFYAAEAGAVLGVQSLWESYINTSIPIYNKSAGETGTWESYKYFIAGMGIYDNSESQIIVNYDISNSSVIKYVNVKRKDGSDGTTLRLTSVGGSSDGAEATVVETVKIGAAPFEGVDFALMANNINCIMCHTRIDNAERYYNTTDSLRGTFGRVKVASLESMLLRTTSADSRIAGTLYTRGIVTDKSGNPITDLSNGGQCLTGYEIDGTSGNVNEPLNLVNLVNATGSPLPENGNLYLNYPTSDADMTDGILPGSFPPAIPDLNGNKIVDDVEFASFVNEANGSLSGGIKYGLNPNASYSGSSLPSSGNINTLNRDYSGNLILIGTAANPIVITGTLAIDGDVIIRGVVKGTGQIVARGNVYVAGDVTYADGTDGSGNRTFGRADDGTQNALAFTVGGNILVGDYLTPKKGDIFNVASIDPGDGSTAEMSFTMSEINLFNRMEWTKTQQFLPDVNNNLVSNATYVSGYQPRYYTMGPGDPVYIYNKNDASGRGTYWDPASNSWQGKEHLSKYDMTYLTAYNPGDFYYNNATVINLAPRSGWVSESQLKQFWIDDENSRTAGEPYKLDGLYYTNNAFFALVRSDKYNSKTWGQMVANGAWVAADMGVLVPGSKNYPSASIGLKLNYDYRLRQWVNLQDYSRVELYSISWTDM